MWISALLSFLGNILAKIGIDILKTPAKTTEVKNNEGKINVKLDPDDSLDRLNKL